MPHPTLLRNFRPVSLASLASLVSASLVFLVVLLASAASVATAQEPDQRGPRRASAEATRIWWNQPRFVEGLGLSAEQREKMNGALEEHLEARREKGRAQQKVRRELFEAAQKGDFEAAEAMQDRFASAAAELARVEGELVVGVLRLMTAEQRGKLAEEFPVILRRPWLFGGAGGFGGGRGRGRGARQ